MSEKKIVLLVEDNPKILELNRRILEKESIMVLTSETLAEARERINIAVPDVMVLDVMLPDGSGLDFLSEIRNYCSAPALFLTAKAEHADLMAGFTAGGNDYITKPYNLDEFRMRVMGLLWLVDSMQVREKTAVAANPLLTKTELSVALQAAEGASNKDIAKNVLLSESRIKTCLSGIYRKLGISEKKDKRELLTGILIT